MAAPSEKTGTPGLTTEEVEHQGLSSENTLAHAKDQEEHDYGVWKSLRNYPWACVWCVYALWCIICLSFDVQAANAIVGIPQFRKDFGYEYAEGEYVLHAHWQSAFNAAPVAAATIAALISGDIADRIGRRLTLFGALAISFIAVALEYVATTSPVFFTGKFLNGLMVGTIGTIMVGYIGEISPLGMRGVFTCGVGISYGVGPLVAFIVIRYTGTVENAWAYRTVFCCQWGFAAVPLLLLPFMPESPSWLASKDMHDRALRNLRKLGYNTREAESKLALIELTLQASRKETAGATYMECFRRSNLRRTMVSVMPKCIGTGTGISFIAGYFTYYLQLAGYSTEKSYILQILQPVASIIGNIMAASLVDIVGRRRLTFFGVVALTASLLITGGLGTGDSQPLVTGTVAFILIFSWLYNLSVGSTAFSLLTEVATSRLRVKTVAIGYAMSSSLNVMWQITIPYMFNPDKGNLGAKIAFVFGGISVISCIYLWYFQPETAGRSYQELDEMFAKRIPAREFKTYETDAQILNASAARETEKL